jgi:hypothetical protein
MDIKTVAFVGVLSNAMFSDKDAALCTWNKPREHETRLTSDHLTVVYKRNLRNWTTSRNRITFYTLKNCLEIHVSTYLYIYNATAPPLSQQRRKALASIPNKNGTTSLIPTPSTMTKNDSLTY